MDLIGAAPRWLLRGRPFGSGATRWPSASANCRLKRASPSGPSAVRCRASLSPVTLLATPSVCAHFLAYAKPVNQAVHLLYFWRGDNYRRDLDYGVGFHLNQANPLLHQIGIGESLWAFTRNTDGRYVLAAELVISAKTMNPRGYRYGPYRVWGDLTRSRYFSPRTRRGRSLDAACLCQSSAV